MNEELQSANEELQTMNEELLAQSDQIEAAHRFLDSILDGLPTAMAVVDRRLDVVVWNAAAEDLFGLRTDDVIGRSFPALDIGLPVGDVSPLLHAATSEDADIVAGTASVTLDALDRRGRRFSCRVDVSRIGRPPQSDPSVMVLMKPISDDSHPEEAV
jgi:two-component system CheB/CheR fusion protein